MASVAKVAVALAIAVTLVVPFASVVGGNTGEVGISESVTAEVDTYQDIEGYDIDTSNFTATDSGGTELTEGTDYELNATDGSVQFLSSGAVSDGDEVDLEYSYQATSGTTSTITGLLPLFVALLILVPIANEVTNRL